MFCCCCCLLVVVICLLLLWLLFLFLFFWFWGILCLFVFGGSCIGYSWGGDSKVGRATDSWLKGRGFESLQENFFSSVDFLCWFLFRHPFHPRVTAVARKRSRSFCQKRGWQITAKHAYTLRMWLCMKWYGAWLYGVHRTCAETAAISCGTSHASAVSTPLRRIFKRMHYKKLLTHVKPHVCSRERRIALYKRSSINQYVWTLSTMFTYLLISTFLVFISLFDSATRAFLIATSFTHRW